MHPELVGKLEEFAKARVNDVRNSQSYDALQMSVISTELMLGEAEQDYDPDDQNYEGFVEALDGIWASVCEAAVENAGYQAQDSLDLARKLSQCLTPGGLQEALYDNYLFGALAAVFAASKDNSIQAMPALAWAAFNKHSYQGYKDEIACLRMLLWAGFDPNAQEELGGTALHFMASLQNEPGSHPRAVRLLLESGIDPNIQNVQGDSALCYLAGNEAWTNARTETAWLLLKNGANPLLEAKDGANAYTLWKQNRNSHQAIDDLVSAIESVMAESQA